MNSCTVCPQIVRDLLNNAEAKAACDDYIAERASRGLRALGVAVSHDDGRTWNLAGLISLLDPPRLDSAETIKQAQDMGVQVLTHNSVPYIHSGLHTIFWIIWMAQWWLD